MRIKRLYTYALATLCWAQVAVVIMSWILGVLFPESGIRTMLRGESIRWFCGHFVQFCSSPLLVWMLLLSMAAGVFRASGITEKSGVAHSQRRMASVSVLIVTILFIIGTALLTVVPHAVLLSAVGSLWHSPFSAISVPLLALYVFAASATFGIAVGRFQSFHSIVNAITHGVCLAAPLFVLFIFASVLVHTVIYVFFG